MTWAMVGIQFVQSNQWQISRIVLSSEVGTWRWLFIKSQIQIINKLFGVFSILSTPSRKPRWPKRAVTEIGREGTTFYAIVIGGNWWQKCLPDTGSIMSSSLSLSSKKPGGKLIHWRVYHVAQLAAAAALNPGTWQAGSRIMIDAALVTKWQ